MERRGRGDADLAMTYDHALDCANNFGMCEIDELLNLSEGLNECADGCYIEDGPEACEDEIYVSRTSSNPSYDYIVVLSIFYCRVFLCFVL